MSTTEAHRVAPFWRDLAILMLGAIPTFFFGLHFGHAVAIPNAVPASATVTTVPKATR